MALYKNLYELTEALIVVVKTFPGRPFDSIELIMEINKYMMHFKLSNPVQLGRFLNEQTKVEVEREYIGYDYRTRMIYSLKLIRP